MNKMYFIIINPSLKLIDLKFTIVLGLLITLIVQLIIRIIIFYKIFELFEIILLHNYLI